MRLKVILVSAVLSGAIVCGPSACLAQAPLSNPAVAGQGAGTQRFEDAIYDGYRASRLLGSAVFSLRGEYLGDVRNIVVADNGQIMSLLVEGAETRDDPEFISRIPWARLVRPLHAGALVADFSDLRSREYGLFFDPGQQQANVKTFVTSKIIGDYARLQAGQGYGYVSNLVFDGGGKLMAVVVSRDASAGGGTFAFPYPGKTGQWSPQMGYYGLPYVTVDQANHAGTRIDLRKFQQS